MRGTHPTYKKQRLVEVHVFVGDETRVCLCVFQQPVKRSWAAGAGKPMARQGDVLRKYAHENRHVTEPNGETPEFVIVQERGFLT